MSLNKTDHDIFNDIFNQIYAIKRSGNDPEAVLIGRDAYNDLTEAIKGTLTSFNVPDFFYKEPVDLTFAGLRLVRSIDIIGVKVF